METIINASSGITIDDHSKIYYSKNLALYSQQQILINGSLSQDDRTHLDGDLKMIGQTVYLSNNGPNSLNITS